MKTIRCRLAPFLVIPLLLAGCATEPKAAGNAPAEEYVYVTVTGSNIPKRIKKSDLEKGSVPKDGDMQVVDKDSFQKSLRPGRQIDKGGGG